MESVEFSNGAAVGYAMYVPEVFRAALRHHDFRVGDAIYDTPVAYDRWSDALKCLRVCFNGDGSYSRPRRTSDLCVFATKQREECGRAERNTYCDAARVHWYPATRSCLASGLEVPP